MLGLVDRVLQRRQPALVDYYTLWIQTLICNDDPYARPNYLTTCEQRLNDLAEEGWRALGRDADGSSLPHPAPVLPSQTKIVNGGAFEFFVAFAFSVHQEWDFGAGQRYAVQRVALSGPVRSRLFMLGYP